jgi:DNA-binding LacI/PurR family transcriptional regulator
MPKDGRPLDGEAATLEEVARIAGVSRATASRVVNGSDRVSDLKRQAVERAVRRTGYVPNRAARSLVTRRTDSIGLVIPEPAPRLFGDSWFPVVLRGISKAFDARGLQLVLLMPQSASEEERLEQYVAAGHVDGVVLFSLHGDHPLPQRLMARGVPTVVSGQPPRGAGVSFVDADNRHGAASAVTHLLERGCRKVVTVTGQPDLPAAQHRLQGYRDALEAAGRPIDPSHEEDGDFSGEGAARAMRALLQRHPDLDGVFVASDSMAVAVLRVLQETGRRVPEDISVVGFDDQPIAQTTTPTLSTVRQPVDEMTDEMVHLLTEQISSRDRLPRHVIFPTQLIVRESSGG